MPIVVQTTLLLIFSNVWYMGQPLRWNFAWAGLCLVGAVYFMFRG